ncbi:MAG TPA: carboxypeptidase-like regulatory domain-containing protein [Planctomycetota bacterium]|nr:carboxypeptidase-like regulatory domain-containing protein [Planctomycetota bacterium]
MRPLVVLLLVIAAALALIFTLQTSGPSTPPVVPPSELGSTPASEPVKPPVATDVQTPTNSDRLATPTGPTEGTGTNEPVELAGKNTLSGLVMNEQKQPLPNAKVELSREAHMGQESAMQMINGRATSPPVSVVKTDALGKYRFTNVVARRDYYLIVSHADYSPTQETLVAVGDQGDFQGPNVVLKTGSVIQGTVTDEGGNVVPSADLWLDSAFFNEEGESPDRLVVKSDLMGHYEFKNVYPVTKKLTCTADGYGMQTISPVNVSGEPGERVTQDFRLLVGQPIAGRVVGLDGVGIKGAKVLANSTANNVSYRGETESTEDGSFQLLNLTPGTYVLSCQAKGYRQQKYTRVAVGNMNVVIDMVAQACINGRTVDSAGSPVTAFTAEVRRLAPNQVPGIGVAPDPTPVKETFTDAQDGNFQLCGLDPGTYTVLASSASSAPTYSEAFSISTERPTANIVVRLSKGGSIKGRVVSPAGTPVGGVAIETHDDTYDDDPNDIFSQMIPTNTTSRRVVSRADGTFEIQYLTPEKYQLRLAHSSFAQGKMREIMVADGKATDVGTIAMQVGGAIRGTVFSAGGGPLAGGFVHLESDSSDLVLDTRSDAEGHFSFAHVRPGNYTLSATGANSTSDNAFTIIDHGKRTATSITVTEGGDLARDLNLGG